jgi:hypothetical protein
LGDLPRQHFFDRDRLETLSLPSSARKSSSVDKPLIERASVFPFMFNVPHPSSSPSGRLAHHRGGGRSSIE